jgi:hypothetical protein
MGTPACWATAYWLRLSTIWPSTSQPANETGYGSSGLVAADGRYILITGQKEHTGMPEVLGPTAP